MKKILIPTIVVVVILICASILKDQLIKVAVTAVATEVTGAPIHIEKLYLSVFTQAVRVEGFKMYNPGSFPKGTLIDIPRIFVDYDLAALFRKQVHLLNVEIELKEMGLVKNREGKLNTDSLKVVRRHEHPSKQLPVHIDILKLNIGKLVYKDFSIYKEGEPSTKVYDININKKYKNITNSHQLAALILTEPMKSAGIRGAEIYGVSALSGVAIVPIAVAVTFVSKDSAQADFDADFLKSYDTSLKTLILMGKVTKENKSRGVIEADIHSVKVTLKLKKINDKKTKVTVSARKYLLPKREIAGGVIYEISEKLKK